MRRREFITLVGSGLLAIVLFVGLAIFRANAQERTWRLGFLTPGAADAGTPGSVRETTLRVLADRGFSEGRNLIYVSAAAEGDLSRLPQLAKMLAEARVDVTIAVGTIAARAALTASNGTPIVLSFAAEDPVETGLAASLAHPGGSVTGIFFRAIETDAKRLELLSEALPTGRKFGFLAAPTLEAQRSEILARTAATLGVSLTTRIVRPTMLGHLTPSVPTAQRVCLSWDRQFFLAMRRFSRSSRPSVEWQPFASGTTWREQDAHWGLAPTWSG
jgi:ABC-type uncharacterized transport system substrate-binding protein